MTRQIEVVYENGVLRPLGPVPLKEHQRAHVTISDTDDPLASLIDREFVEYARQQVEAASYIPTLEEVRRVLSKSGGSLCDDITAGRENRF